MPKGIMVVQSGPSDPTREAEYNDWYDNTHIPQVCATPGFVGAHRYKLLIPPRGDQGDATPAYLAIYDLDAPDLGEAMREFSARSARGEVGKSDVIRMDPRPIVALYQLLD